MSSTIWSYYRLLAASLLVILGLAIAERGVIAGAPFTFTMMGVVMAGLGIYRLRLVLAGRQR